MECIAYLAVLQHVAPMEMRKRVGANIKAARLAKADGRGWSLQDVAKKIRPKTSYQHIARLERGGSALNFDWVEKIALALGVDPIELIVEPRDEPSDSIPRLSEQVATQVAETLAAVALRTPHPDENTVELVALALQELLQSFSVTPEAARDASLARIATGIVGSRYAPSAN